MSIRSTPNHSKLVNVSQCPGRPPSRLETSVCQPRLQSRYGTDCGWTETGSNGECREWFRAPLGPTTSFGSSPRVPAPTWNRARESDGTITPRSGTRGRTDPRPLRVSLFPPALRGQGSWLRGTCSPDRPRTGYVVQDRLCRRCPVRTGTS